MKIALVLTGLSMAGAERQVCDLADQYVARGHEVLLVCLTASVIVQPKSAAVRLENLSVNKSLFGLVRSFYEFRQLISAFNPDVVHSHMVHANIFSRLLRLTTRIPRLICTAHNSFEGGRLRMLAYRLTDSLADLSTNVSEEAVQAFINKGAVKPGRMVAVYNGIDTRYFCFSQQARDDQRLALGISDGGLLLLAVGRLTEAKDYPSMLMLS